MDGLGNYATDNLDTITAMSSALSTASADESKSDIPVVAFDKDAHPDS